MVKVFIDQPVIYSKEGTHLLLNMGKVFKLHTVT